MDRTFSDQTHTRRTHAPAYPPALPPWEIRNISQVPFIEPGSPPHAERDGQGFFHARGASRSPPPEPKHPDTQSFYGSRSSSNSHAPPATDYASPVSATNTTNPWKNPGPVPYSAVTHLPSYETQTLETPVYIPPAPRTAPTGLPAFVATRAPPTPPDSFTRPSPSPSRPTQHHSSQAALPGTMSSRGGRDATRSRARSATREARRPRVTTDRDAEKGFGLRFKSAFKGIFHRSPVDESQFTRVSGKHWTEEEDY
nr:hypothetical protein B0A51_13998 [Rachicladosporium sp. CCFEE 5018]